MTNLWLESLTQQHAKDWMTRQLTPRITGHVAFYERNHHSGFVWNHVAKWPNPKSVLIRPLDQFRLKKKPNTDFSIKLEKQETLWYTWSTKKKNWFCFFWSSSTTGLIFCRARTNLTRHRHFTAVCLSKRLCVYLKIICAVNVGDIRGCCPVDCFRSHYFSLCDI